MSDSLPPELQLSLAGLPLAGVHYYASTGSTNAEAAEAAANGAPDLTLFTADEQTAGRGRLSRHWVTNPGSALAFSLLLRPSMDESAAAGLFSPWGAVSLCEALEGLGLRPEIKWPNDVLLERRKVCGILPESAFQGSKLDYVVIGMGVNVSPGSVPPPETLKFPATCVEEVLGRPVDRWHLLAAILQAMLAWRGRLQTAQFRQEWGRRLAFRGEWVTVGSGLDSGRQARILDLTTEGGLLLEDPAGHLFNVQAGEVSLRPMEG
jgi:BirA family biotin operon repressor/biotin-[acetyl-CoA-carboxylase] ligase